MAGVYSHGLNRFPRVVEYLKKGEIDPKVKAEKIMGFGAFERWDGHRGFGPLNAKLAMDRAVELAKEFGMGIVALGNNNHWMRGGSYGWQAADQGCIGICWSNTCPNMPAWGGMDRKIGNNPLIFAVPRSNGEHAMIYIVNLFFFAAASTPCIPSTKPSQAPSSISKTTGKVRKRLGL